MLASMLLAPSRHDEVDVVGESEDSICNEPSASSTSEELLGVMAHATARLNLAWSCEKQEVALCRLKEWFLSGHNRPSTMSLPFLTELHGKVEKSWKKLYSSCVFLFQHTNYANVDG